MLEFEEYDDSRNMLKYAEAYLEPCWTSKMERFAEIVNG